ncbi:MAG TPA: hypothetical protein ENN64_00680, partial [bacterium]|nr:hypothetical protein [bacterium]
MVEKLKLYFAWRLMNPEVGHAEIEKEYADLLAKYGQDALERCEGCVDEVLPEGFEREFRERQIKILTIWDSDFPGKVTELLNPPRLLFFKGEDLLKDRIFFAVVGTRNPTTAGKKGTVKLIEKIREISLSINKEMVIISGFARGIDTVAHRASLDNKLKTVAVIPEDISWECDGPRKDLYRRIIREGTVISEWYGKRFGSYLYILRNELLVSLADIIIVVESGDVGGSIYTARFAKKMKKPLITFSKGFFDECAEGGRKLIKDIGAISLLS